MSLSVPQILYLRGGRLRQVRVLGHVEAQVEVVPAHDAVAHLREQLPAQHHHVQAEHRVTPADLRKPSRIQPSMLPFYRALRARFNYVTTGYTFYILCKLYLG